MMKTKLAVALALAAAAGLPAPAYADRDHVDRDYADRNHDGGPVELGPRPFYLVEGMDEGQLKDRLLACEDGPFYRTDFSIGHRGAPLQFPEHSDVSYRAAATMGAGVVECDVSFTKDGELVCRHSECDLHTTTDVVATPLNAQCTTPWSGPGQNPAPKCCTSDLTLSQFKSLKPKMDAANPAATTAQGYLGGTASWRTDLYTGHGQLMSFKESIALNQSLGVKHTPELKTPEFPERVNAVFGSQQAYAQAFINELRDAGVDPKDAWVQSFNPADIRYWIEQEPRFGRQAVYLDSIDPTATPAIPRQSLEQLRTLRRAGVRIFAPPMWALLAVNAQGEVVPSDYARDIRRAGLDIITWSFERSDLRQGAARAGWYYQFDPTGRAIRKDSDMYKALDVLAREVGVIGIFSDWPATVSYYASCMRLK